ncbi:MAG: NAD/NADP octopine/nopaline dehydrogenase family protein [Actinobacteria bacterium]|nr:NAD/NADP octopine/nopaline dehydrogenase family protein [Actinomycetota bacterium]
MAQKKSTKRSGDKLKVTVVGAGHGGLATAGHIALDGHSVTIFSFYESELEPIRDNGGIKLEGGVEGFADSVKVAASIDAAVRGADLVLVNMPALAHRTVASLLVGCLKGGQVLLFTPGRTGGALEVYNIFRRYQFKEKVTLAEAQTFLYATESRGPAHVEIMKVKERVRAAALPASDNDVLGETMAKIYPMYTTATNVIETSINNVGGVVHPAPMLMNSGLLERAAGGEDLRYYRDIVTRFVCGGVLEKLDEEKANVGRAFDVPVMTLRDWYAEAYGVKGDSIYEALQNNHYYVGFSAPHHVLGYHHVLDEVPNSLVSTVNLASIVGVETPMTQAISNLACAALGVNFWSEGRSLDRLGIAGKSRDEVLEFVNSGKRFWEASYA